MSTNAFPALPLAEWQDTRDTLTKYAKLLSEVRFALTPKQKHYWHLNLQINVSGLTTMLIPAPQNASVAAFEMQMNLQQHALKVSTTDGTGMTLPLHSQLPHMLYLQTKKFLAERGIRLKLDANDFPETEMQYDKAAVERYWQALSNVAVVFGAFKAGLRGESGPVSFWTHHFDLDLLWFSGRLVPGVDPKNAEHADEQMGFGFTTGDEVIAEPYFYATAYPLPKKLPSAKMPEGAAWQSEPWQGAVLKYEKLLTHPQPEKLLLGFLRGVQKAAARLMR